MSAPLITADELRRLLNYDADTGVFTWRVTRTGRALAGSVAGAVHVNRYGYRYVRIRVAGKLHVAHRLAWLHVYGAWPSKQLDHIDGNALNNRISNLREATNAENMRNRRLQSNNTSGYKGVRLKAGKWEANIKIDRKQIYLGRFVTPESAHAAYLKAANRLFGEFATGQ